MELTRDTQDWYLTKDPMKMVDRQLLHYIGQHAGPRILDLGSGSGGYSRSLMDLGRDCVALDVNADYVQIAQGLGVHAQHFDGHTIPFADQSFDTVIAIEVLEHVPNPDPLLREIARVTRGNFIATVPNCSRGFGSAGITYSHMLDLDHRNFFSKPHFQALLASAFAQVQVTEVAAIDQTIADEVLPWALSRLFKLWLKAGWVKEKYFFRLLADASVKAA